MAQPWMDVIGIGEDGVDGLSPTARKVLEQAELIIGGDRHHDLAANGTARRIKWPSPFDAMIDEMQSHRGKRLVVLVTGDNDRPLLNALDSQMPVVVGRPFTLPVSASDAEGDPFTLAAYFLPGGASFTPSGSSGSFQ